MTPQLLVIFLLFPIALSSWSDCKYVAPNGDIFDLSALQAENDTKWGPGYVTGEVDTSQREEWYFSICRSLKYIPPGCSSDATICRLYGEKGHLNQSEVMLYNNDTIVHFTNATGDDAFKLSVVQSFGAPDGGPKTLRVDFHCSGQELIEIAKRPAVDYLYTVSWFSDSLCSQPHRISKIELIYNTLGAGAIIAIILAVLIICFFITGIIVNITILKKRGIHIIPLAASIRDVISAARNKKNGVDDTGLTYAEME
ncbi:hypothetical protein PROFUN_10161 [Planoprotostelium fungivorum]|uniref:Autophagy-related protein 27 n=1 Tax=Planoprotostelium fungivorum TaxID=1890364 RepID=A0A2P6NEN2_9EUKA|nr:hypothetical protein PROFUN_10161 [Planoprotostelium fungivorum]